MVESVAAPLSTNLKSATITSAVEDAIDNAINEDSATFQEWFCYSYPM